MKVDYYTNIRNNLHFLVFETFNKVYTWGLSQSDLRVLAEFYNVDYELVKSIPTYKERMVILFSKDVKEVVYKRLKMSYNTFNNVLSKLRKKGIISENAINETYLFNLEKKEFNITLRILDETGNPEAVR